MIIALAFSSCEKETEIIETNQMEKKVTPDYPWVLDWSMCCNPETCLGEDFIGAQGWSFSVSINSYYANQMNPADYYIYIRPHGSGLPFVLRGQTQNNSNPAFFDLGMIMEPGCYDVKILNSLGDDPVDVCDPTSAIDFTFCCGGLIE